MSKNLAGIASQPVFDPRSLLRLGCELKMVVFFALHHRMGDWRSLKLVGLTGLEPVTLRLSSACSNQLSYRPALIHKLCRNFSV